MRKLGLEQFTSQHKIEVERKAREKGREGLKRKKLEELEGEESRI